MRFMKITKMNYQRNYSSSFSTVACYIVCYLGTDLSLRLLNVAFPSDRPIIDFLIKKLCAAGIICGPARFKPMVNDRYRMKSNEVRI